jgi:proteasome lid subunit RPN8/RPN11
VLILRSSQARAIEEHGSETYPEECCGFLLGPAAEPRRIATTRRAKNIAPKDRARRYVIDPMETLTVTKSLAGTSDEILGFYHSHPDHPAVPSEYDRGRAWPWWSYLISSIVRRTPTDLRAWILDDATGVFRPDELRVD